MTALAASAPLSRPVVAGIVTAALILLTALWPQLGRLIARIPPSIAQAMLAGVLLPLCLAPVRGVVENPWGVIPVVLTWLVFARLAPRWAVPLAFVAAAVVVGISVATTGATIDPAILVPQLSFTTPTFTLGAVIGVALPLFLVTMASQNVPGVAIMRSFGYEVPWRPAMLVTGLGTAVGAVAGGHAINLAAISAALAAGPEADPDAKRRWVAVSRPACRRSSSAACPQPSSPWWWWHPRRSSPPSPGWPCSRRSGPPCSRRSTILASGCLPS
jgi:benzoate membrane transport protein